MSEREEVLRSLEPLFKKAEKENLWFYSNYQDMWFSPEELRENHARGSFIWGAVNWQLRDPREKLNELRRRQLNLDEEILRFEQKLSR